MEAFVAPPLALALWSLRRDLEEHQQRTIEWIAEEARFSIVEVAGFHNLPPSNLSALLSHRNIKVCSLHGPTLEINAAPAQYVRWARHHCALFATQRVVFASDPTICANADGRKLFEDYKRIVDLFGEVSLALHNDNILVSYHCYSHDFIQVGGRRLIDSLIAARRAPNSGLQLDTMWLMLSRVPAEWLNTALVPHIVAVHISRNFPNSSSVGGVTDPILPYLKLLVRLLGDDSRIQWILETFMHPSDHLRVDPASTIRQWGQEWPTLWQACKLRESDQAPCKPTS